MLGKERVAADPGTSIKGPLPCAPTRRAEHRSRLSRLDEELQSGMQDRPTTIGTAAVFTSCEINAEFADALAIPTRGDELFVEPPVVAEL